MGIRKGHLRIVLGALVLCKTSVLSQQPSAVTSNQPDLPVGVWEAAQPDGSVIGIDLATVPASEPDAVYPEGTPRPQGSRPQIGVYQRLQKTIACGEEIFFAICWTGPGSSDGYESYANRKLETQHYDRVDHSEIHVELVLDPGKDVWTGRFHRKGLDGQVILHRTSDRPDPAQ